MLFPLGLFFADLLAPQNLGFSGFLCALVVLASFWSPTPAVPLGIAAAASAWMTAARWFPAPDIPELGHYLLALTTIWGAAFVVVRGQHAIRAGRHNEAKWRSIAENPFDYLAVLDRDGVYQYLNRAPNGAHIEDLVGHQTFYDRLSPEAVPAVREALKEVFRSGKPTYLEVRARHQDRWFGCNLGPIEHDGEITAASVLARDITARKKAVDTLRAKEEESRERFSVLEDIYRSAPVGHCMLDGELRYVRVNEWLAAMNGISVQGHIDRHLREIASPFAELAYGACKQVLETQQPVLNLEIEDVCPETNEKRFWLASFFPWGNGAGGVRGVHVVVVDTTALKNAVQALSESEGRFRAIFDHAAAGIALIDPDGRFERVNPALCSAFGFSEAELVGRTVDEVTHPDDVHLSRRALAELREGRSQVARFQKRYRSRTGTVIWTKAMVAALDGADAQARRLVAVIADITEQVQAQQALTESERVRQSIMDSSPDFIVMLDRDGRYLFINRTAPGYTAEDIVGRSIYSVVSKENAEIIARSLEHVTETRGPARYEVEHVLPNGATVHYDSHVGPVIKDGEVTAFIIVSRDTTDRKRYEQALQESEDRYRNLTELSPNAILLKRDGRIVYVNSAGLELFGAESSTQITGKRLYDLLDGDSAPVVRERMAGLRERGEKPPLTEGKILRLDGSTRDVEVAASKIVDRGETAIQIVIRDVTKRKKAEAALARSEQHFRSLIENSLDVFSILNEDGTSRYQSPSLARVLGYQPEELDGKEPFALIHPDDAVKARARFCEGLRVPGTHQPVAVRMRHRDGTWRNVEVIANNQLENPAVHGIVVTSRDVTERQKALDEKRELETQLWQAQKLEALGVLAGGIAHDFNNLLTSVEGFARLASEELSPDAGAKAHIDEAIGACERARELVQQMLTFGRRDTHSTQPLNIAAGMAEGMKLLRATIPKAIEIHERLDADSGQVLADPVQLQQVLMNLSTNAYQAMAPGPGTLQVELAPVEVDGALAATVPGLHAGSYARLVVRDSGPGIAPDIQSRIFEPFFTTKGVGEGSGLGLSVVHGIVTSHGGAIRVESPPGRGACFSVYFPRLSKSPVSGPPSIDESLTETSEHVLFVDDEEPVVRLAQQILRRLGYRVTALKHGTSSLDAFRKRPASFDLVISDISMPEMSGIELASAIKKIRPDMPVILTTGFPRHVDSQSAKLLGVHEVLCKPFTPEQLGKAIRCALTGDDHSEGRRADVQ